jgi:hypothetical protein
MPGHPRSAGVVGSAVHVVAAETRDAARIHQALDEVVPLHPVLVAGCVGKVRERRLTELVLFEFPEVLQRSALMEADGPVVVLPGNRALQRLSL